MIVVVPAHQEEERIGRCLESVARARHVVENDVTSTLVVVADGCTDRTADVARRFADGPTDLVLETAGWGAGQARRVGTGAGLVSAEPIDDHRTWIASTDADSVVPPNWLRFQLHHAGTGVDAIAGTVSLADDRDCDDDLRRRFRRYYRLPSDGTHPHVHGCNLGLRASTYRTVGGWRDLRSGEDNDLWRRVSDHAVVLTTTANPVATSARRRGRAPAGFADAIDELDLAGA